MNNMLKLMASILFISSGATFANENNCDLEKGKRLFSKCAACHTLAADKHMMGPSLHNLAERKAGSVQKFRYSNALKNSDIHWDQDSLNHFLKSPMSYIPGTTMPFGGLRNDADRQALVCYLLAQKNT